MNLTDTHAHICDQSFDADRDQIIRQAENAGISHIIAVSETLDDIKKNLTLAEKFPQILVAGGLCPEHLDLDQTESIINYIRDNRERFIAIGEVGLDFWIVQDDSQKELQKEIFGKFIDLAIKLDLPLNVHSRSAGRQAVQLLLEKNAKRVQMHAFDGKYSAALPAIEAGYFFSMPPSVNRSPQKQKLIKRLPLSVLLLESDSPVLGPDPKTRNEPANLLIGLEAISKLTKNPRKKVIQAVIENTSRLYGIK
ncbi:MAG: TatD family hydrolase [Proteobacteria bacterium]|nr:TatD family hydrolase [Pseudomonadota bacterium]MBU1708458.1 TatD family hydrolase [Pseudomonadota bacterium]